MISTALSRMSETTHLDFSTSRTYHAAQASRVLLAHCRRIGRTGRRILHAVHSSTSATNANSAKTPEYRYSDRRVSKINPRLSGLRPRASTNSRSRYARFGDLCPLPSAEIDPSRADRPSIERDRPSADERRARVELESAARAPRHVYPSRRCERLTHPSRMAPARYAHDMQGRP